MKKKRKIALWWKKIAYWKKGGIIGFLIGLFPLLIQVLVILIKKIDPAISTFVLSQVLALVASLPAILLSPFALLNCSNGEECLAKIITYGVFLSPIFYSLIGMGGGYLISKIKRK